MMDVPFRRPNGGVVVVVVNVIFVWMGTELFFDDHSFRAYEDHSGRGSGHRSLSGRHDPYHQHHHNSEYILDNHSNRNYHSNNLHRHRCCRSSYYYYYHHPNMLPDPPVVVVAMMMIHS